MLRRFQSLLTARMMLTIVMMMMMMMMVMMMMMMMMMRDGWKTVALNQDGRESRPAVVRIYPRVGLRIAKCSIFFLLMFFILMAHNSRYCRTY